MRISADTSNDIRGACGFLEHVYWPVVEEEDVSAMI
jgi:hypothetical protein